MSLPFFYSPSITENQDTIILDEANSKHTVQVLRMQEGERLRLTDGKGQLLLAKITLANKRKTEVRILAKEMQSSVQPELTVAISILKNPGRFEWFLEKAAELGVSCIQPLICDRTEKQNFRTDRGRQILISAMLQSQQTRLTRLIEPETFSKFMESPSTRDYKSKYIAHCLEDEKDSLAKDFHSEEGSHNSNVLILIGPEGDFSAAEIKLSLQLGFKPVGLGRNRLRTETAGIVAATLILAAAY